MWNKKTTDYGPNRLKLILENGRLEERIRLLKAELKHYKDREEAAPAGCMAGPQCSVCKHGYSTGDGINETKKYHCKLAAAKLCERFEEATP